MSRQISRLVACAPFRNRWFLERGRQIPPKSAISRRLLRHQTSRVDVSEDPICKAGIDSQEQVPDGRDRARSVRLNLRANRHPLDQ